MESEIMWALGSNTTDKASGGDDQEHPQEKEMQKAKWLSEEALQIAKKRSEKQRRKGKI